MGRGVSEKKTELQVNMKSLARSFYADIDSKKLYRPSLIQTAMFHISRKLMQGYDDGNVDKE